MIDPKTLKQLVRLMVDNDLTEMNLEDAEEKIRIRRGHVGPPQVQHVTTAPQPMPAAAPQDAAPAAPAKDAAPEENLPTINSPMVGSFYTASSPDSAPYVKVGDTVTPDTVVCIIEAMKVFNEIKAETSGTIEKLLVENGQAVEFGQPLFVIRPN